MGADAQAQVQLQMLLGMIDFGLEPQQVIETPRWVRCRPGSHALVAEPRVGADTIADLQARHNVVVGNE